MSQAVAVLRHAAVAVFATCAVVAFVPFPNDEGELEIAEAEAGDCPEGMVSIGGKFCIDRYEASTVEGTKGKHGKFKVTRRHSPYKSVDGVTVKAVSIKGRVPQGYISRDEAEEACENAGKRLCTDEEWLQACRGKEPTKYPYGDEHEDGYCNDSGFSGFNKLYGPGNGEPPEQAQYTRENMNDERLNQLADTVAPSGKFSKCKGAYKVYDMVGNLHEWTAAKSGTFRGGYYLDTHINGDGCEYRTTAHNASYHDYSTGFRCCYGGAEQKKLEKEKREEREEQAEKQDKSDKSDKGEKSEKSAKKKSKKKKG